LLACIAVSGIVPSVSKGISEVKAKRQLMLATAIVCGVGLVYFLWRNDAPRRYSFKALDNFCIALNSGNADALLQTVVQPSAVQNRTAAEQAEFLVKALQDEISPEGLAALKREGQFGALKAVFPDEATKWSQQAGVNVDDCVAFKMERGGIRAEVVLLREGQTYRVVRCNNVKQMGAEARHS
jgi:hypothetical protein